MNKNIFKINKPYGAHDIAFEKDLNSIINKKNILIVGSGSNEIIKSDFANTVYVNTSFVRNPEYIHNEIAALFIAEGYFDVASILSIPANKQLMKLRKDKIDAYQGISVTNIFTISSTPIVKIKKGLRELGIEYKNIIAIRHRQLYWCLIQNFFSKLNLSQLISYLKTSFIGRKPKPSLRPSNGMCAAIFFKYMLVSNPKIMLDGILGTNSFYGTKKDKYVLNNVHEAVDRIILKRINADAKKSETMI
ncbi:hypothetical protein N8474_00160 [Gammaproteobacteria bacterium]|nr:hypothetical protein [Gammaproteobacteria bacterium]